MKKLTKEQARIEAQKELMERWHTRHHAKGCQCDSKPSCYFLRKLAGQDFCADPPRKSVVRP